ncbi:MAG: gamma carbonic anhydrase family protein [Firmicutes bacterium]|nr:gamma carbonic anhydrase family protein [Bacillota bacterium]
MILAFGKHYPVLKAPVFVAPGSYIVGRVEIQEESSVWFNAVIRADGEPIQIGKRTNVQDQCVIHADPGFPVTIGDRVTIGHRAIIHGASIASDVLVGMGAVVMNGAVVESQVIIAAGSLIPERMTVPQGSVVMGSPARRVRSIRPEEIEQMLAQADSYVARWLNQGWHFH